MNKTIAAVATLALGLCVASGISRAQDNTRNWENGYVTVVTEVTTKPGMFNAYINDLNNVWRKFNEAQMEDGDVISYQMMTNSFARDDEPNLFLIVTYANWAAFDRSVDYFEQLGTQILGSVDDMRETGIERGELREIGGSLVLQEINFMDE